MDVRELEAVEPSAAFAEDEEGEEDGVSEVFDEFDEDGDEVGSPFIRSRTYVS
ncbi:hypothetical protein SAMN04487948_10257 [Halogranum amylolyticum]|uniref:Uncharacterized protein n=1 Tax=Halogranum amylolyticum TaxID=660520 RepID=A0A1H8P2D3_9EURY|nr:hypothetical protein SAMN04487948_10257 [Halogranum amylolyticum]